jgi:hypothetical protein
MCPRTGKLQQTKTEMEQSSCNYDVHWKVIGNLKRETASVESLYEVLRQDETLKLK